jgi:curved DNA-binding protein CbpA
MCQKIFVGRILLFRHDSLRKRAEQLLGLRSGATKEEITRAFRRLALKYHPDRCMMGSCKEKMQLLVQARDFLIKKSYGDLSNYKLLEDDKLLLSILPKGAKLEPLAPTYEEWHKKHFYGFGGI